MPNYTENYKLKKPLPNENYNIQDQNDNMDIIDSELKKLDQKVENIEVPVTSVNGKTGDVELTADDVGAETPAGAQAKADAAAAAAVAAHDTKEKHIAYAVASGTNTYTVSIPGISQLVEGMSIKVKFANGNTGASTMNINGLGAKSIVKGNGGALTSGYIKAGQILHLVYTGSNFQLLGEGGEYGTAQPQHVLEGYTIGTEEGIKEGTMVNQGAKIITPSTVNQAIPAGYHNGQGYVKGDANLKPENIKSGVSIFGKVGTYEGKILIGSTDTVTLIRSSSGSGRTGMLYITDIPFQPHFIYAYDETDGIADSFFIACDGLYNNLPKFQIKYDDRDSSFSGATQIGSFIDGGVEYHYPNWEGPRVHIGFQSDYIALYVGSGTYRYIIVG